MDIIDFLNTLIHSIGLTIEYIGLFAVGWAVIVSLVKVVMPQYTTEHVRAHLAKRVLFGLELIISADIMLATVATTSSQDIYRLGGIVLIRVLLGYSLRKEALIIQYKK